MGTLKDDGLDSKCDDNHIKRRRDDKTRGENDPTTSIGFREPLHKVSHPGQPKAGLKPKTSYSQDSEEYFMDILKIGSQDSDGISTLSKVTGCTTIGSVSISTENSAII